MKKEVISLFFCLFLISLVGATSCTLDVSLINQDPYPAVPGDYVDLLFQLRGVENKNCDDVIFSLVPEYPFKTDPEQEITVKIKGGTYTKDFNAFLMVPYKVRVDNDAMDGINKVKVKYSTDKLQSAFMVYEFDVNIQEVRTEFEVYVKDYDSTKRTITFEILNSGKNDVEALTFEIPKQDNIAVKGSPLNIIGALDSNDFTTTSFEATPLNGEIKVNIHYTDSINKRRSLEKTVIFEQEYFQERLRDEKPKSNWFYIILIAILILIFRYFYKKHKKSKKKKLFS